MTAKHRVLVALILLVSVAALAACKGNFDEETGVYRGKGITATFPVGWEAFSGVPNSVVARSDPNSSEKVFLTVQDVPADMTLDDYYEQTASKKARGGFDIVDEGEMDVGAQTAGWQIIDQTMQGVEFRSITYTFVVGGKLYQINGLAEMDEFADAEPRFDAVAESAQFQ